MKWKKGQSGNPAGRPPLHGVAVKEMRARIGEHLDALVDRVLLAALAGDMTAAKLLLDKLLPNVKPESAPLALTTLPTGQTWSQKARSVLDSAATGDMAPDVAAQLIDAMGRVANIDALDDLRAKLAELESLA